MSYEYSLYTDSVPVSKPTGVNIYPGLTSMSASWDKQPSADVYHVTVSGMNESGETITRTFPNNDNTFYIEAGLVPDQQYRISIVASKGSVNSPAYVGQFTTLPEDLPASPCSSCKDNDDCVAHCPTKAFCVNGSCQVCDPNRPISTDSLCYSSGQLCTMVDNIPQCVGCSTDSACMSAYGPDYRCDSLTNACHRQFAPMPSPSPIPSPSPSSHTTLNMGILIALAVGLFVLLVFIGLLALLSNN